jgi:hypothetical protein
MKKNVHFPTRCFSNGQLQDRRPKPAGLTMAHTVCAFFGRLS